MAAAAEHWKLCSAVLAASMLLSVLYRPLRQHLPYNTRDVIAGVEAGVVLSTLAVNRGLAMTVAAGALVVATSVVYAYNAASYPFVQSLVIVPACLAALLEAINVTLGRALKTRSSVRVSYVPMMVVACLVVESVVRGVLNTACYPATIANVYFGADDLSKEFQDAQTMINRAGNTLVRQFVPGAQSGIQLDSAVITQPAETQRWILYCGGNMEVMEASLKTLNVDGSRLNANVILFNPRGVGRSTGRMATITDLIDDGVAIADFYVRKYQIASDKLLLIGHSIGGGVASGIAARRFPQSPIVMDRTFTSLSDAAVGFSPVTKKMTKLVFSLFVGDLDTWTAYQALPHKAKLVLYSTRDEILNYRICSLARLPEFQDTDGRYHDQVVHLPTTRPPGRAPHNIPFSLFADSDAIYNRIERLWTLARQQA